MGIRECSGNQALKDIILGLRWIKENIRSFNGDPDNVTLLGSSSGAQMIHFLMLSPAVKGKKSFRLHPLSSDLIAKRIVTNIAFHVGLFHKAVVMGYHAFNPVVPYQEENESFALKIAKALGYAGNERDKKKLLSFFKLIPAELLIHQCRLWEKENYEAGNHNSYVGIRR